MKTGDAFFQSLPSWFPYAKTVEIVQGSKLVHCGLIYEESGWRLLFGKWWIVQAFPPCVMILPLWLQKLWSIGGRFQVVECRHIDGQDLICEALACIGIKYDAAFRSTTDALYCSELLNRCYIRAHDASLGEFEKLVDLLAKNKAPLTDKVIVDLRRLSKSDSVDFDREILTPKTVYETLLLRSVSI